MIHPYGRGVGYTCPQCGCQSRTRERAVHYVSCDGPAVGPYDGPNELSARLVLAELGDDRCTVCRGLGVNALTQRACECVLRHRRAS